MLRPTFRLSICVRPAVIAIMAVALGACMGDEAPETSTAPAKPATKKVVVVKKPVKPKGPVLKPLPHGLSGRALKGPERVDGQSYMLNRAVLGRTYGVGESQPARIAMLLPFSGRAAPVGQALFQAAQMALFDAGDPRLSILPKDTGGTEEGARQAVREAVSHGAQVIVGPLFGRLVDVVRAEAELANIPVISFTNDRQRAGRGVYTLGLPPEAEVTRMVAHAVADGHVAVAAFLPDSAYGMRIADALRQAVELQAVELTHVEFYPAGATADNPALLESARRVADFDERKKELDKEIAKLKLRSDAVAKAALKRLEKQDTLGNPPYTAIFLAEGRGRLSSVVPLLPFYDVNPANVRFFGLRNWYGPDLQREPALIGARFPMSDMALMIEFNRRYAETFGTEAPGIAPLGYEAVALVATLMQDSVDGSKITFTNRSLTNAAGFSAYSGPFRLLPSGYAERHLGVVEIAEDGVKVLEPPRTDFSTLIN